MKCNVCGTMAIEHEGHCPDCLAPVKFKPRQHLVDLLENEYCFRDYRILPARYFREIDKQGMHVLIEGYPDDWPYNIENKLSIFVRDGYGTIYFYL